MQVDGQVLGRPAACGPASGASAGAAAAAAGAARAAVVVVAAAVESVAARLRVQPDLQVRQVQRSADGLHVRTQHGVRRPENGLYAKVDLLASWPSST